jgi:hypothetical protein
MIAGMAIGLHSCRSSSADASRLPPSAARVDPDQPWFDPEMQPASIRVDLGPAGFQNPGRRCWPRFVCVCWCSLAGRRGRPFSSQGRICPYRAGGHRGPLPQEAATRRAGGRRQYPGCDAVVIDHGVGDADDCRDLFRRDRLKIHRQVGVGLAAVGALGPTRHDPLTGPSTPHTPLARSLCPPKASCRRCAVRLAVPAPSGVLAAIG